MNSLPDLTVVGGGLAGSEAAWQAAQRGLRVHLYEMRPGNTTGAHKSGNLAELVCSNSLGSSLPDHAAGVLVNELKRLNSLLIQCAIETALPAGNALAVDRELFSENITDRISAHPNINILREEVIEIPAGPVVVASGPLTTRRLADNIAALAGEKHLFFYDAVAPIVTGDSIDMSKAFLASRYDIGEQDGGDYINCPLTKSEYHSFVGALLTAGRIPLQDFEKDIDKGVNAGGHDYFEGCLPVEVLAGRGKQALAFGPMRPVGITDPRTGSRPHAIVQLRRDNLAGSLYNMVGFQTNLTFSEQKKVFRMIPGLEGADFIRFGQMHRNTYLAAPRLLLPTLQFREIQDLFFAGQISGVEGYLGNIATGLLAGVNAARLMNKKSMLTFPKTTMLGSLCFYISHAAMKDFQPMKANFGILPPLESVHRLGRRERARLFAQRAAKDLEDFLISNDDL